jgi:hypothetical protein
LLRVRAGVALLLLLLFVRVGAEYPDDPDLGVVLFVLL